MNVDAPLIVSKRLIVPLTVEAAFHLFTAEMGRWWPVTTHSIAGQAELAVLFDGRVGGLISERTPDGTLYPWAEITAWDPPRGFRCRWYPGHPLSEATDLSVAFSAADGGTEVELTHSGWEVFGTEASVRRQNYDTGWDTVLAPFTAAAR